MNFYAFSMLVTGVTSFLLAIFVFFRASKNSLNLLFVLYAICTGIWGFGQFFREIAQTADLAFLWCKFYYIGAIFIPIVFFHFILVISNKQFEHKISLVLSYFSGLLLVAANLFNLLIIDVEQKLSFNYYPVQGRLYPLFTLMFFSFIVFALVTLFNAYIKAIGAKKNQLLYIVIASLIGFSGGATTFLPAYNIDVFPYGGYFVSIYVSILAYAITKHELMDIRVAITRTAAYGMAGSLLVATFVLLNLQRMPLTLSILANSSLGLFWAWGAHRLRTFIQTPLQEKWITDWYDSDKLMNNITRELVSVFEREGALQILADQLKNSIKISHVHILLAQKDHLPKPLKYVVLGDETKEVATDHPFIRFMFVYRDVIRYDKLSKELKSTITGFDFLQDCLYLPILSSDTLEGVIILGPKVSEDHYNEKDLTLFRTVLSQALVVIDRIRPYEKIRSDLEIAERELARSQRLAAVGTLTAGVTHEIRNPLAVIRSETERLAKKERDQNYIQEYQSLMLKHIDRIVGIVQRMLSLAKEKPKREEEVDLNTLIDSTLKFFEFDTVTLNSEFGKIAKIRGNYQELQEVFVNLTQNAFDAMERKGTLKVKTYMEVNRVVVEISDTGKGIPEEIKEKIFDPFFSSRHEGVGLGLSIVYRIIREHGADISVDSEIGKGTMFRMVF
ncbi:ATP-binding protein [Candidatus Margulisiibacteriota bacterium]